MSAGFTPGPWKTAKSNCGHINVAIGAQLLTPRWTNIGHIPEMEANARLIAAAPELYEALVEAREQMEIWASSDLDPDLAAAIEQTDAALAKARGDQ